MKNLRTGIKFVNVPDPTPIYRFFHIDNLELFLKRGRLHAPRHTPKDGLIYKTIHDTEIQQKRSIKRLPCAPNTVIHDYVSFYFGFRSPMMYLLNEGGVKGYNEGQEPLIYAISFAQIIKNSNTPFVFSDGHGIANYTQWYNNLSDLDNVDWNMVYQEVWRDTPDDMDSQRRKQAEFLVYQYCDWSLIQAIAVINERVKQKVEKIFSRYSEDKLKDIIVKPKWYYKEKFIR